VTHFWTDRPALITGASGLVGGWLTRRLVELGADVVCLLRDWTPQSELLGTALSKRVKVVSGDVRDQAAMERVLGEHEIDTVFHLAAQTTVPVANRNPVSTFESNIAGTWSVLEACRRSPLVKQIVLASSDKAYGDHDETAYTEEAPLKGAHPYDVSKTCADLIAQSYAKTYGTPVVITRCGNFFGGGDLNWNRIVPGTIRSVLRGERPVIRTDGKLVRDYFYVEDGAIAYTTLAESLAQRPELRGQAFNFSNETPLTTLELVGRVLARMGSPLEPVVEGRPTAEIRTQRLSAKKARMALGWSPTFDLDGGLTRTIAWYERLLVPDARPSRAPKMSVEVS